MKSNINSYIEIQYTQFIKCYEKVSYTNSSNIINIVSYYQPIIMSKITRMLSVNTVTFIADTVNPRPN